MSFDEKFEPVHAETTAKPSSVTPEGRNLQREIEEFENRSIDFRTIMAIIALVCGYEAALLSYILPANIIFAINADVGPSAQANWIAQSWSLAAAVIQPITGRCSDIFGRRYTMIGGNIFGFVGCILAARASSVNQVMAGCSLVGIGAGAQQLAYACVNEVVPRKTRGRVIGLFNLSAILGSVFGSVIGSSYPVGIFEDLLIILSPTYAMVGHASWRWAFYLGCIINGCAIVMVTTFYWPSDFLGLHPDGKTRMRQFKELDFLGLLLFAGGLATLLVGLSFGGNPYSWTSATVLGPLFVGGVLLFILFPLWEIYCPAWITKLCPPKIFKNYRGFAIPIITIFVSGMLFYSLQALWPQQIQLLFTKVPEQIGWFGMALGGGSTFGGFVSGILFAKIKHTKWQFLLAIIVQTLFIGLMGTVNQHTQSRAIAFVVLAAVGIGFCQVVGILTVQLGVNDRDIGVATGLSGTARTMGGSIAIAIYGAVIRNKVSSDLGLRVAVAAVGAGLNPSALASFIVALTSRSATALSAVKGITPEIIAAGADALTSTYSDAFKLTYLISIAFGGVAIIAACFVRSVDHLLTQHVAVKLDKPHLIGQSGAKADSEEEI